MFLHKMRINDITMCDAAVILK